MKVLILCPKFPFDVNKYFDIPLDPYGGWIDGLLSELLNYKDLEISCLVLNGSISHSPIIIDNIKYFYINYKDTQLKRIFASFDIYHIFGIEHEYLKSIEKYIDYKKTLLYIAGLQSECRKVYLARYNDFYKNYNPLLTLNLWLQKYLIKDIAKQEINIINNGYYITGRTNWDKEIVKSINPNLKYYHCNESLRSGFYNCSKWNYKKCEKHTVYMTQGAYTIKGTHVAIHIIKKVKEKYPNVKCYISGEDLVNSNSLMTRLHSSYAYMIKKMIKENKLENNFIFIGPKDEDGVIEQLQNANVFLSSSIIENSCNSLQEAMLVGTPCVSSRVGGLESIANNGEVLFYDFDNVDNAANNIIMLFENQNECERMSKNSIKRIEMIADRRNNAKTMHDIYVDIYDNSRNEKD